MMEISKLAVAVMLFSVVSIGGYFVITEFTGQASPMLPGYYEGTNLTEGIEENVGTFKDMSEEAGGVGVLGLVGLIKDLLFLIPRFASSVVYGIVMFFRLPIELADLLRASIYAVYILGVGILVYRGVKTG
jgi:hypothetical protein